MKLFKYQNDVLEKTKDRNKVAYYLDMGLGKTFVGSEKLKEFNNKNNLVVCQKSKLRDWLDHFKKYYDFKIFNLTNKKELEEFYNYTHQKIGIINYDLIFRRPELLNINDFTLMLDESSLIQNEKSKRSKFILKLKPKNVILLSGTPVSGKYENLWSQAQLLGWDISKKIYESQYIKFRTIDVQGFPIKVVDGYKNVDRLKSKLRENGAVFMKTEEVIDLPSQNFIDIKCDLNVEYKKFKKTKIIKIDDREFIGDRLLTYRLYLRMMAGQYNKHKIDAFKDILNSTNDRLIVFYNFENELKLLLKNTDKEHISIINGNTKDLKAFEEFDDSITFIQYQAGAMGLNLQKANKIIYFSPTESSELFEQSKKRIHRVGQDKSCFYYLLISKNSIEEDIYKNLKMRRDFTNELFREIIRT